LDIRKTDSDIMINRRFQLEAAGRKSRPYFRFWPAVLSFGAIRERSAVDYHPPKSDVRDTSTRGSLDSRANLIMNAGYIRHERTAFVLLILRRQVLIDAVTKLDRAEPAFEQ
jgi:hypothetical protein